MSSGDFREIDTMRKLRGRGPLQDGDDMRKEPLKDGNGYGCTLNAAGTGILLQLDDGTNGDQVRVRLDAAEADYLAETLLRLAGCLPKTEDHEPPKRPEGKEA